MCCCYDLQCWSKAELLLPLRPFPAGHWVISEQQLTEAAALMCGRHKCAQELGCQRTGRESTGCGVTCGWHFIAAPVPVLLSLGHNTSISSHPAHLCHTGNTTATIHQSFSQAWLTNSSNYLKLGFEVGTSLVKHADLQKLKRSYRQVLQGWCPNFPPASHNMLQAWKSNKQKASHHSLA